MVMADASAALRAEVFDYSDPELVDAESPLQTWSGGEGDALETPIERGEYLVTVGGMAGDSYELVLSVETYEPAEPDTPPGDEIEDAFDLGDLDAEMQTIGGYVGQTDAADYFRFNLVESSTISVHGADVVGGVTMALFEHESVLDEADAIRKVIASELTPDELLVNLPRGEYLLRVTTEETGSSSRLAQVRDDLYTLHFQATEWEGAANEPASDPGAEKGGAEDLGTLSGLQTVSGHVGRTLDPEDYFRFELAGAATVDLLFDPSSGAATAQIFADASVIDEDSPIVALNSSATGIEALTDQLPRGVYYVRIVPLITGSSSAVAQTRDNLYTLNLSATRWVDDGTEPASDPGDNANAATRLGVLTERVSFSEFVGRELDPEDYYQVSLSTASTVTVAIEDVAGRVTVQLFADAEVIDESAPLFSINGADPEPEELEAGLYFVRVVPLITGSSSLVAASRRNLYTVTLTAAASE